MVVLEGNDLFVNCTTTGSVLYAFWINENGTNVTANSSVAHPLHIANVTQSSISRSYSCRVGFETGEIISSSINVAIEGMFIDQTDQDRG